MTLSACQYDGYILVANKHRHPYSKHTLLGVFGHGDYYSGNESRVLPRNHVFGGSAKKSKSVLFKQIRKLMLYILYRA
jgi:hypothetical protein